MQGIKLEASLHWPPIWCGLNGPRSRTEGKSWRWWWRWKWRNVPGGRRCWSALAPPLWVASPESRFNGSSSHVYFFLRVSAFVHEKLSACALMNGHLVSHSKGPKGPVSLIKDEAIGLCKPRTGVDIQQGHGVSPYFLWSIMLKLKTMKKANFLALKINFRNRH